MRDTIAKLRILKKEREIKANNSDIIGYNSYEKHMSRNTTSSGQAPFSWKWIWILGKTNFLIEMRYYKTTIYIFYSFKSLICDIMMQAFWYLAANQNLCFIISFRLKYLRLFQFVVHEMKNKETWTFNNWYKDSYQNSKLKR